MTGFLKKYAIAAAVWVSGLCFVGAAHAVIDTPPPDGDFGLLTAPATVTFSGYQDGPKADLTTDGQDQFVFQVDGDSAANATTIAASVRADKWKSFSTSLWNGTSLLANGVSTFLGAESWESVFSFSPLTVSGSPYYIRIDGVTNSGSDHATYAGSMTISAIPEPGTFAMMLAGLGLMGFIARRRKQNAAA